MKGKDGTPHHGCGLGRRHLGTQRLLESTDGARMQLRHTGLVDANFASDLLHRRFAVVVAADDLLFAWRQRGDGGTHADTDLLAFERDVSLFGLGWDQCLRQRRLINVIVIGDRRSGLNGLDADDRAAQPLFVRAHLCGEIRQRRLATVLAPQRFARGLKLAPLAPHTARPGVLAQGINHRAADTTLSKRLELDAAAFIEATGRVDEPDDAILHKIPNINRVRHRRGDTTGELFDKRNAGHDKRIFLITLRTHGHNLRSALTQRGYQPVKRAAVTAQFRHRKVRNILLHMHLVARHGHNMRPTSGGRAHLISSTS